MELDPITQSLVHMKLYKNVKNVVDLRKKLMSGQLQCCVIKPSLIVDPFQVIVAANKALTAEKMKTKSVFTEILFNLSVSTNISKSLQAFGINDSDNNLLVVTISKKEEGGQDIFKEIIGEEVELKNLSNIHDVDTIRDVYNISETEFKNIPLIDSVVSRIASKDFL